MTSDDATLWYDSLINKLAEKYNASPELATPQQERAEENSETEETPTEEECSQTVDKPST